MNNKEAAPKAPKEAKKQKVPKGQKDQKAPKAKKGKEPQGQKDRPQKKKIPKILFIILPVILLLAVAGVVVYILFFRAPPDPQKEKEKIAQNTAVYQIGEDEIVSLESVVEEGVAVRASVEIPMEDAPQQWIYHYRGLTDTPSDVAASYVEILRGEEQGFILTDEEHHELLEEPDMKADIGSLILARESVETAATEDGGEPAEDAAASSGEDVVHSSVEVVVAWSETALAIQVSQPEGTVLPPVQEEDPAMVQREPLALQAQLEYFNNLDPAKLGLSGDFMSEYRVYPVDGLVRVSGMTCRVLNVYLMDLPAETNTFMGTYYLSTDNSQIFKLDENGVIVNVDMS